ncbi:nitroreductase family protein [Actinoplanes sp. NEAU-A12]|uniref:Nitroreductase family protein n=1 Tax=Actinoplanes sandaracinus TaxID=3045177 RepID=A0ABT6WVK0_9ACTN|nr:nitroreductase family protein [Actinoplanes sandaracinus]MDI6103768.1 nitroreductase family protein [Actinoplanes sandaracinus]
MIAAKTAATAVPLHPLLAERWSPRGFDRTHVLSDDALTALLEAARWAPSANNSQPWRFLPARRGETTFDRLHAALVEGNQTWAVTASALLLVAAQTVDDAGRARPWALYDAGQAVASLVMQAQHHGLAAHQMGGFDPTAITAAFGLDPSVQPVVVLALGRLDPTAALPSPLAAREHAPRTRMPLDDLLLPPTPALTTAA